MLRMATARYAAFADESIATVATGIPVGICTVEYNASTPPSPPVETGMPITGSVEWAATAPARSAAFPAPPMTTPNPFPLP